MKILIGEDDPIMAEHLRQIVLELGYSVCAVEHESTSIVAAAAIHEPDLVLLDIRMDTPNAGMLVAQKLNNTNVSFAFLTAHTDNDTLEKAGNLYPFSYLVKPYNKAQIKATLSTFYSSMNNEVQIKVGRESVSIMKNEILYIQTEKNYCEIYSSTRRDVVRCSLNTLLQELNYPKLLRVHKSYAVNKSRITKQTSNGVWIDEKLIPTSTVYYK
ncbi:MAG: response regulator transcription factor [Bacteroidetes bacterium]|nr:response regulator transcription factor [Bacteroidota bacterium]